jgi:hypothetical protein
LRCPAQLGKRALSGTDARQADEYQSGQNNRTDGDSADGDDEHAP